MEDPRCPDVEVELTGQDGNIFFIAGRVGSALKHAGYGDEANEFYVELTAAGSYQEALRVVERWVSVY